ncbi:MAG: GNAT family N-acetyltransferase [Rhodobacteraceae bacterium]|nr:GNAT family N-acetyltransferase [Paracoccaceae bacterium]
MSDVSEDYLGWLKSPASEYILSSASTQTLTDLTAYVANLIDREDVLFLGIFEKNTHRHIGNLKYEPVDVDAGCAVMGILIGETEWQGKGVAQEVLTASALWLARNRNIKEIILGVDIDHVQAIRAYEKIGFRTGATPYLPSSPGVHPMIWRL